MTNELGSTLQDIEAKAERKREVLNKLDKMFLEIEYYNSYNPTQSYKHEYNLIRKYIEEN